jgi:hypothetical protein
VNQSAGPFAVSMELRVICIESPGRGLAYELASAVRAAVAVTSINMVNG